MAKRSGRLQEYPRTNWRDKTEVYAWLVIAIAVPATAVHWGILVGVVAIALLGGLYVAVWGE